MLKKFVKNCLKTSLIGALLVGATAHCMSPESEPFDNVVYLGGDCQGAYQLYHNGLRQAAFPFDWTVASCNDVSQLLLTKFDGFMQKGNLELVRHANGNPHYVLDKKTGVRFHHDFTKEDHSVDENFMQHYDREKEKYTRRVSRLLDLLTSDKNLLIVRKTIDCPSAAQLKVTLDVVRPEKASYKILALDTTEEIKEDWQIPSVENRYLRQTDPYQWEGDSQAWKELLQAQGLTLSDKSKSVRE